MTVAAETSNRDEEGRQDELAPRFTAVPEPIVSSQPDDPLRLRVDTAQPLSALGLRLLGAPVDVQFSSGQRGTDPGGRSSIHDAFAVPDDGIALRGMPSPELVRACA